MTATLDTAGRLSQPGALAKKRLVAGDGLASSLAPAERLGSLEPGAAGAVGGLRKGGRGAPERICIAIRYQHAGIVDHLGNTPVPERRHRAPARHTLEARQPKALIAPGEQQAPGCGIQGRELASGAEAGHAGTAPA